MFSSYFGTILRAFFVLISIVSLWYLAVLAVYFMSTLVFSWDFSFLTSIILFIVLIIGRLFYPRNVFS